MGEASFKDESKVNAYYAESMALVVFLMHADGAAYRDGFLDYVADAYRGQYRPGGTARTLMERLGLPAETLDERFRRVLAEGVDPIAGEARPGPLAPGGNLRLPGEG